MTRPSWDQRIERARELAKSYPFTAEVLEFYAEIAAFQKNFYLYLESTSGTLKNLKPEGKLEDSLNLTLLLSRFPSLLTLVEQAGPTLLAEAAGALAREGQGRWEELLVSYWTSNSSPGDRASDIFFSRAFLETYAEYLVARGELSLPRYGRPVCPFCGRKPLAGVLRQEGHGAKRSLVCSLCSTEWDYLRIVCPACGEDRFDNLPVYTSSQFEHVRVDACESCKTYIKTVDLTKNGLAVPVVDELATTPLDLWAQEKGYTKLERNLFGM